MSAPNDKERKKMAERHEKILVAMTKEPSNAVCADCGQPGPRWASWNLGVFLCIRCSGFHRKMGTHISRVKSISLDVWTAEQIESIQAKGNAKVNARYNPHADLHPPPSGDREMEQYIRNKYERRLFMDRAARDDTGAGSTSASSGRTTSTSAASISGTSMAKLRSMGFTDEMKNATALRRTRGNLEQAIDILVSDSPLTSVSRTTSNSKTTGPSLPPRKADPMVDLLGLDDGFAATPSASGDGGSVAGNASLTGGSRGGGDLLGGGSASQSPGFSGAGFSPLPAPGGRATAMPGPSAVAPAAQPSDTDSLSALDFGQFTDSSFFSQPAAAPAAPASQPATQNANSAASQPPPSSGRLDKTSIMSLYSSGNSQRNSLNSAMTGLSLGNTAAMNTTSALGNLPTTPNPWQTAVTPQSPAQPAYPPMQSSHGSFSSLSSLSGLAPPTLRSQPAAAGGANNSLLGISNSAVNSTMGSPLATPPPNPMAGFGSFQSTPNSSVGQAQPRKTDKDLFGEFSDLLR
ncbi:Gtpase activating protein [Tieghemiomyces parasiticus]|uniref:Gtpase activating protein n=1 Tax=Tieghemiomyces parasiticus TaxID=78921 RepID=A0A9W8DU79_9FUNG|nr:Gtpase activating protein [Tieghemiomyces parasiticus]